METSSKITVTPVNQAKTPGRPRIFRIPRLKPFSHYQGSVDGKRTRCTVCKKFLKKGDFVTCGEECRKQAQEDLNQLQLKLNKDKLKWITAQAKINKR